MEIKTLAELETEATRFVGTLAPRAGSATLVTLSGELGAGKTTFVQAAAKALGVRETVTSPTFVLEKIYPVKPKGHGASAFTRLVHIDAYRLEGACDLAPLGFDAIMHDPETLVMLEWPERVGLVDAAVALTLTPQADGSRTLTYG